MAAELGLDELKARRAGLLHDIGKAVDHQIEGTHAKIGADLAKRYGESPDIVNAIASHNEFMVHLVPMIYRAVSDTLVKMGADEIFARNTLQDHALIMEALENRDASMARHAMAIHMSHAIQSLRAGDGLETIL